MVKERMDLLELLRKRGVEGDVDFLREALRVLVEEIMEAEVSLRIGAGYGERSPERVTQRNGYRSRAWDTRVGTMELQIPKLREGSYFPSLLEPRRRSERAQLAVIQQAYVEGVSTRRVDDLVKALGCEGISKSQVSRICSELDEVVEDFLGRPLDGGSYPYLWLDALTQKVREAGRIVNVSVVVATAVNSEGKREIVGMDVGTSEDGAFWLAFLRSLVARGLGGVELVVSDAHQGLRDAIATVFGGASWQRCRTHFMTNLLTRVPRRAQPWVATMSTHHLPAAVPSGGPRTARAGDRPATGSVPSGRLSSGRGWCGRPGLLQLPRRPLEEDLVQQPPGASQQGDTATHRCRGHLPQPASRSSSGWGCPGRTARRMGHWPTLHDTRSLQHRRSSTGGGSREGSGLDVINRMTYSYTT